VPEVQHLVEHRIGQAFHLGDAIADLADDSYILPCRRRLGVRDLGFNFLEYRRHGSLA
jgi:hypothetical protein